MTRVMTLYARLTAGAAALAALAACATGPSSAEFDDTDSVYGAFLSARYAGAVSDPNAAADFYRRALAREPGNALLIERAFASALAAGDVDEATRLASSAVAVGPTARLARILLAGRAIKESRYEDARVHLEVRDLGPFNQVIGDLVLAWAETGAGDVDAALAILERPQSAQVLGQLMTVHRALVLDVAGRSDDADAVYREALAEPDARARDEALTGLTLDAYGRFLERAGRTADARALYTKHAGVNGGAVARTGMARLQKGVTPEPYVATPAHGASAAVFGPAAALASNSASELAIVYLRLALDLHPEDGAARYVLGDALTRAGRDAQARDVLKATPAGSAYHVPARISAAWSYLREEQPENAAAALESVVADTDDRDARLALGHAYRALERYQEAGVIYDSLIRSLDRPLEERDWALLHARGVCYERTDQWPNAEADFLAALELSPNRASVLNYLGYTWVDRGEQLERAFEMIQRAVNLEPDSGYIVDSLGWAYYRLGDYDEAVRHLERAVELAPQDPTINDHLGDAYWRVGRRLEAVYQWRRALTLDPEAKERIVIEAKLEDGLEPETSRLAEQ